MSNLTKSTKPISAKNIKRQWHIIDVSGKVLGRISPIIARLLQGKNKVDYISNLDIGDFVVVINAKKVILTGKKSQTKIYSRYSGYPGGLRQTSFLKMFANNPQAVIKHAVSGMLPKNKLRDRRLKRLYIFPEENHPYIEKFKLNK